MTDPPPRPEAGESVAVKTAFDVHGPIRVAPGGRHLAHADGTPFFFLADTAWNGVLLSSEADWQIYLADRKAKGFTAIQFIITAPWAGALADAEQAIAFEADDALGLHYSVHADFFRRTDARIAAINAAGLLAVPVLAWAAPFGESARHNPGLALPAAFLTELIEYQVARYRARHVLWLLAGDGRYGGLRSWKWKRIGRRVFGSDAAHAPVGLHPMGKSWPYRSFKREKWLDLLGYQSGHADDDRTLRWLLTGPPATAWQRDPRPVLNLEPCYEGIRNWGGDGPITNAHVRRALYASLLNAPTAGVTYGAHGVWSWETTPREPLNHAGSGVAKPWHEAIHFPGSLDVQRLAGLFNSIEWWRLRPAPWLLRSQPGEKDLSRFISAAATDERDLAILYLPHGGEIALDAAAFPSSHAEWFDPRTARRQPAMIASDGRCNAPSADDFVLVVTKGR